MADLNQWNNRYQTTTDFPEPCQVLVDYAYLLPSLGSALDLACGLGANAFFLANRGLETYAWDYAKVAITRLQAHATSQQVPIYTQVRDVVQEPPPPTTFDVIVICHFLDRSLIPSLIHALKPNGLLFYQTFTRTYVDEQGPKNPDYRLANNELLKLFSQLKIIMYREEGRVGDTTQGFRNQAQLIAQNNIN
jgi:2-polyprenyl-3-methyl-5-hydroxy-6-metoxy-1,4-benzoquinol methylase